MTPLKYLPLLIPCSPNELEGNVGETLVRTLPYRALELFEKDPRAFEKLYGVLSPEKIKRLGNLLKFAEASLHDAGPNVAEAAEKCLFPIERAAAVKDPAAYVQKRINPIAGKAHPVLWRGRKSNQLSPGLLCQDISVATAVLLLFRLTSSTAGATGECVICGKVFVRERGSRRKTCSDRCRMRLSRKNRRTAKSQ